MPTVAITGARGYFGSHLIRACRARGWAVRRLVRERPDTGDRIAALGRPVEAGIFAGCNAFIHCAYDFHPRRWPEIAAVNVEGSKKLFAAAAAAGVTRHILISSMSAFAGCRSDYGRAKLAAEAVAAAVGAWAIRPGLLFSAKPGSMVARLQRLARLPVLPLPDGGKQTFYFTPADELAAVIAASLDQGWSERTNPCTAAAARPYTFREVLTLLAPAGRPPQFVSVPSGVLLAPLRAAEACGLALPFKSDSLISLLNQDPAPNLDPSLRLSAPTAEMLAPAAG